MKSAVAFLLLSLPILARAQITLRLPTSNGFKVSLLACGQEITNVPTVRPRGFRGDTVVYNQSGSEDGKISIAISYFQIQPITAKLSLQSSVGFRRRGFTTDTKFDSQSGFALPSAVNTNQLDNLFFDVGLRLHSGVGRKVMWFLSVSDRLDYLIYSKTPFWDKAGLYRRLEFSPVFQAGFSFAYGVRRKRCFVEFEGNPGVMNVLKKENGVVYSKPPGTYPSISIQTAQKTAINYSIGLSVGFEL
jgi:hypothetical protein